MRNFSAVCLLSSCLLASSLVSASDSQHYGYVEPLHGKVVVVPKETRVVTEALVKEGDEVKAGELLARLECGKEQVERDIVAAKLEVVRADLDIAEDDLKRKEELFQQEIISEHQVTQARLKRNSALARFNVALKELELADYKMQNFEIRAPVSGKLHRFALREGRKVSAGDSDVVVLGESKLGVRLWVDADTASKLEEGKGVNIRLDGQEETSTRGHVVGHSAFKIKENPAAPEPEEGQRFVEVIIELDDEIEQAFIDDRVIGNLLNT